MRANTFMHAATLALRSLTREWRSGELGVLLSALAIAVAALTGVGFLVNRISLAVERQATEVLAADLRLESPQPIAAQTAREATRRGLSVGRKISILSVVFHGDANQLTNLRFVSRNYPLRGVVKAADTAFAAGTAVVGGPSPGEIWPDSKLMAALSARVGDELSIGARRFRVAKALISRPDQSGGFGDLAPTALLNDTDLAATQLLQPGSRARFALLFAGERRAIDALKAWLIANKANGERLVDVSEASPQIRNAVDRAGRFLSLASLVAVLLCAISVAMSAHRYVRRHLDAVALLKTLGVSRGFTLAVSLIQLLVVAILATIVGSILGFAAQAWLLRALQGLIAADLPPPDFAPVAMGALAAIAMLAGFALPPLLQLTRVPAIRVLRRDVEPSPPVIWLAFGPAVAAVVALIYWVVRDTRLFVGFVIGLGGFVAVLALGGALLVWIASAARGSVGVSWRYGIANLSRRRGDSIIQTVAFGLGIMVLLLLAIVRGNLLTDWQRSLPADAPNFFFINIPPGDSEQFTAFLASKGAAPTRMLPMIRARLTLVNGVPVASGLRAQARGADARPPPRGGAGAQGGELGEGFAEREQNITWTDTLGDDNHLTQGRWWEPADHGKALVSLATEFQEGLGLKLGDRLSFDIAGETQVVSVASVRKVKWDSFRPNFFIVFPPGLLDGAAGTWMTSAYLDHGAARSMAELVRRFPSVSVFDLDELLTQVRAMIDKAALAVQSVFLFTLLAGLTVLLAAVQASRDERRYESAMLRTLGASRAVVLRGVLAEFVALGLMSGLLAGMGASVAGWYVATRLLDLKLGFDLRVIAIGLVAGALFVGLAGWLATRSVINQSPLRVLRGS